MIPFAVVGSERDVIIEGKPVRGRKNRWGVINVEDERHCESVYLRNFLTRYVPTVWFGASVYRTVGRIELTYKTSSRRLLKFITRFFLFHASSPFALETDNSYPLQAFRSKQLLALKDVSARPPAA
jgi:hypothetical protein